MNVWEVTHRDSSPVMFCASDDEISLAAEYRVVKGLVKRAKAERVAISAITVTNNEDGTQATLMGTASD
jgi:hypothetical protein